MTIIRLEHEERRKGIVGAAVPLFARKGFAGTTTKEIAEAAGVSEALLFKHFPSKAALYDEIVRLGCLGDPELAEVERAEPSTATLVERLLFILRHFVTGAADPAIGARHRLMLNSILEDGEYCRLVLEWVSENVYPEIAACFEAAEAAGDLVETRVSPENRFWFGQHLMAMLAFFRLPARGVVPYRGGTEEIIVEAARFILRGLGLKDEAIARFPALLLPVAGASHSPLPLAVEGRTRGPSESAIILNP